ncbi:hypothetical protein EDD18DRAFT_1344332 [Armillaria luteobubalina]|uniref:Uncharacterized protein n=1 Tax=Armillaria luteobubalina TaxID=153913 RepID=A0AA39QM75_9AGAR|nr:hypothetical protein EDD18DRAFT_1344332 [Armillaria luteobubalina]
MSPTTAIHSHDEPVPVFNCHGPFKLSTYNKCPITKVDPENGSIVLIIFTLSRYKELSYNIASYNIRVMLQLTDPSTEDDGKKPNKPLPTYLTPLHPIGITGEENNKDIFVALDNNEPAEKEY